MVTYRVLFLTIILVISAVIIGSIGSKFVSTSKNNTESLNIVKECWEWKGNNCAQNGFCYIPQKLNNVCNSVERCITYCVSHGIPMDNCYINESGKIKPTCIT